MKNPFIICFCCTPTLIFSQQVSKDYLQLGAYSLQHTDIFSLTGNPASLSQSRNAGIGVYGEKRFLLTDLSRYQLVAACNTRTGNFGLQADYFGSRNLSETFLSLIYGRKLGVKADIGLSFEYHNIKVPGYGQAGAIGYSIGSVFHLSDKFHAGFKTVDPFGSKYGKGGDEKRPSLYAAGIDYDASEKLFLGTEIEKEEDRMINIKAGMHYKILPIVHTRLGISTSNSLAWFGTGFQLKNFRIDLTANIHPQLGISPGLLLLFNPTKN